MNQTVYTPICIIGAGGIVRDAHLPAYAIAGFEVSGIVDQHIPKARELAQDFQIKQVYDDLAAMVAANGSQVIYDIALPASAILQELEQLPDKATVLIQKPLGENLQEARAIQQLAQRKQLLAGVNFQLRFAPFVLEARRMIAAGFLGTITDFEVYVNVSTPWELWDFLFDKERVEINYHSIHYIDLIRSFLGTPEQILARTFKHPLAAQLASVKSNILMDYGDEVRAAIHTNHHHFYGNQQQQSYIKIEGEKGAIKIGFGALIDYPHGAPDLFEYRSLDDAQDQWKQKTIEGTWFPHAFIGTMQQMQFARAGQIQQPENSIDDALLTMACVEAAYVSNQKKGGILIDDFL